MIGRTSPCAIWRLLPHPGSRSLTRALSAPCRNRMALLEFPLGVPQA